MTRAYLAVALVACAGEPVVIAPVIDGPDPTSSGAAFPDVDELVLSIAHAGAADDLLSATFTPGQTVELTDVPTGDDLVVHLLGRLAGTEVAYGRTCSFAIDATATATAAPHLYFARTVHWASRPPPGARDRRDGVATTYHDGSAMFAGGVTVDDAPITAIDRFDPRTGAFEVIADVTARRRTALLSLGDGREVLFGGLAVDGTTSPRVEALELDASAGRRVDAFDDPRLAVVAPAAATLTDGRAMVFGGLGADGQARATVIELDDGSAPPAVRELDARLAVARSGATATRMSDDLGAPVAIIGGLDDEGHTVGRLELFKPLRDDFTDPVAFRPTLAVPRARHHAVRLPDGSVLVIGGVDDAGQPVRHLEVFSIDGGFTSAGELPADAGVVDGTATTLPDGRVLLTGGRATVDGPALASAYIARLNPEAGTVDVIATDPLAVARAGHRAALLCDGTVIVVGGADAAAAERYNPPPGGRR